MAIALAIAAAASGCAEDGLSPRERPQSYSDTIYDGGPARPAPTTAPAEVAAVAAATTLPPAELQVAPKLALTGPISVAVVQMGEVAPPESAIRAFQARPDLFSKVDPLAGRVATSGQASSDDMTAYRTAAANLGDDYVLVFGGTLDDHQVSLPWSVLDLTIVGAFVVPSEQVTVTGRAAGSLVDVRTGRLGFGVSADAKATSLQPSVSACGVREPLSNAVRQELQDKLIVQTQDRLKAARGSGI